MGRLESAVEKLSAITVSEWEPQLIEMFDRAEAEYRTEFPEDNDYDVMYRVRNFVIGIEIQLRVRNIISRDGDSVLKSIFFDWREKLDWRKFKPHK